MRIQSIAESNTQQQPNPFVIQNSGDVFTGRSASQISFEECLRAQIRDIANPVVTRGAEGLAISSLWGYIMQQGITQKSELKIRARTYEPWSDS